MKSKRLVGAPEEIRTPDPQIRSLIGSVEIATDSSKPALGTAYEDQRVKPPVANQITPISTPLGEMLTRAAAGQYLKAKYGFGSAAMLAKLAMTGGGPAFHKTSAKRSLYPVVTLDAWAMARFGEARATFKSEAA